MLDGLLNHIESTRGLKQELSETNKSALTPYDRNATISPDGTISPEPLSALTQANSIHVLASSEADKIGDLNRDDLKCASHLVQIAQSAQSSSQHEDPVIKTEIIEMAENSPHSSPAQDNLQQRPSKQSFSQSNPLRARVAQSLGYDATMGRGMTAPLGQCAKPNQRKTAEQGRDLTAPPGMCIGQDMSVGYGPMASREPASPNNSGLRAVMPKQEDTNHDHTIFRCDHCSLFYPRREKLQLHKKMDHGVLEWSTRVDNLPFPDRLKGKTNITSHNRTALRILQGGYYSTSPCLRCKQKGRICIVNCWISSSCTECALDRSGIYCGAAGVMYKERLKRHTVDGRDVKSYQRIKDSSR